MRAKRNQQNSYGEMEKTLLDSLKINNIMNIKLIIDTIFAACCGTMYGMADLFGRTYEYVNVVLFCYVES